LLVASWACELRKKALVWGGQSCLSQPIPTRFGQAIPTFGLTSNFNFDSQIETLSQSFSSWCSGFTYPCLCPPVVCLRWPTQVRFFLPLSTGYGSLNGTGYGSPNFKLKWKLWSSFSSIRRISCCGAKSLHLGWEQKKIASTKLISH